MSLRVALPQLAHWKAQVKWQSGCPGRVCAAPCEDVCRRRAESFAHPR